MNYSVCFSARTDYFSGIRSFAEPAVRFYDKFYLDPFTLEETDEYVQAVFGSHPDKGHELGAWLYEKTLGHPYFLAFISRQLLSLAPGALPESPAELWPEIFRQLEREKFRSDLAQLSEKDSELLREFARGDGEEFGPSQVGRQFDRVYFRRLADKGLLLSGNITLSISNWSPGGPSAGRYPAWFPVLVITRDIVIVVPARTEAMSGNTYGRTQQRSNGRPTVKSIMAKENGRRRGVCPLQRPRAKTSILIDGPRKGRLQGYVCSHNEFGGL